MSALSGQLLMTQAVAEVIVWSDDEQTTPLRTDPIRTASYKALFSSTDSLTANSVTVSGGAPIHGAVYGGVTTTGLDVTNNRVTVSGGSVSEYVFGGYSGQGISSHNRVIVSGGSVGWDVFGGLGQQGASHNTVTVSGGLVQGYLYGGYSFNGHATHNTVTVSGGEVTGILRGGYSDSGTASHNTVTILGGKVASAVYGGDSDRDASHNTVTVSGGSVLGYVFGGYSRNGSATHNTVTISGDARFTVGSIALYGGGGGFWSDVFTGNTLNYSASPFKFGEIANFQYYNFTLDPNLANRNNALIEADIVKLGDQRPGFDAPSHIAVTEIKSGAALSAGDKLVLASAQNVTGTGLGGIHRDVKQGISLRYDVQTTVNAGPNGQILAEILPGPSVNPQLKSLSEGRVAGLMLATRGADVVAEDLHPTIQAGNRDGFAPFIQTSAARSRYHSGSHIDADDVMLVGGLGYRRAGLSAGIFAETGWSRYDTYNSFAAAASVRGDGQSRYTGGGVFGRYDFDSGPYAEASVRTGTSRTQFDTGDLVNPTTGESAHYNLRSRYTSAHVGVGYPWVLNERDTLDVSVKYLWTHVDGKNATVAGDPLRFDSLQSQRVRLHGELSHRHSDSVTLVAGLGYEYEFNAQADGATYGYAIEAPSLKGSTGILSLGASFTPVNYQGLSVNLRAQGYLGKREGVSGLMRVNYAF